MFVFNRPLGAVAAGLGVALLVVCLDGLSSPLEAPRDARASDTPATPSQPTSGLSLSGVESRTWAVATNRWERPNGASASP
jgi:hypothetical protein